MKRLGISLLVAVALVGCGDDGSADAETQEWLDRAGDLPACADVIGQVASAQQWDDGLCADDGGSLQASMVWECSDGRTLASAGPGWGYYDDVVQAHADDVGPPWDEVGRCTE